MHEITLTLLPDGQFRIQAPLTNRLLSLGMLAQATAMMATAKGEAAQPEKPIVIASPILLRDISRMSG